MLSEEQMKNLKETWDDIGFLLYFGRHYNSQLRYALEEERVYEKSKKIALEMEDKFIKLSEKYLQVSPNNARNMLMEKTHQTISDFMKEYEDVK